MVFLYPIDSNTDPSSVRRWIVGQDLCINLQNLRDIIRYSGRTHLIGNVDIMAPGERQLNTKIFSRGWHHQWGRKSSSSALGHLYPFYTQMENCENLVTSDRLAILVNIADLEYRLNSTYLNDSSYSYSTALVVLAFANCYPNSRQRIAKYRELVDELMTYRAYEVLYRLPRGYCGNFKPCSPFHGKHLDLIIDTCS